MEQLLQSNFYMTTETSRKKPKQYYKAIILQLKINKIFLKTRLAATMFTLLDIYPREMKICFCKNLYTGNLLVVQWFELDALTAEGPGSISDLWPKNP